MKLRLRTFAASLCLASLSTLCHGSEPATVPGDADMQLYSSSNALPEAPGREVPVVNARLAGGQATRAGGDEVSVRPFSAFAVAVKVSTLGLGFDVATPLSRKFNVRGGAEFFSNSPSLVENGINVNGTLNFRSGTANLDWFPFGGKFRVSPGVTFYNGNSLNAIASVPGGQTFDLNSVTYTSSKADPVTGTFNVLFGNKAAPSLTIGTGNMLPRKEGSHWSVPFEFGVEYTNTPQLTIVLSGSACDQNGNNCTKVATNTTTQANLAAEQSTLQNDLSALRVFPIISIGLGYKF